MKEQMTEFEKQLIKNLIDINFSLAKMNELIEKDAIRDCLNEMNTNLNGISINIEAVYRAVNR